MNFIKIFYSKFYLFIILRAAYDSDDVEELTEPSDDEIKEDQWLGVTVRSQGLGGKVSIIIFFYYYCIQLHGHHHR